MSQILFTGDITLPGDDEFARKFNNVSALWQEWKAAEAAGQTEQECDAKFNQWFDAKFALESGH